MPLHDVSNPVQAAIAYVGHNVIGASTIGNTASTITHIRKQIVVPYDAIMLSVDVYWSTLHTGQVCSLFAGVQNDNAGAPGSQIISMGNFGGNGTAGGVVINAVSGLTGWVSIPIGCYVLAGTYWLRVAHGGSGTASASVLNYDSGGSDQEGTDNNTWFNPTTATNNGKNYSIRAGLLQVA